MQYIAHRREDGTEQTLLDHLEGTAALCQQFASAFGSAETGLQTGLFHDAGKYSTHFQRRIREPHHFPPHDHATAGAKILGLNPAGLAIAGHHGGIPDGGNQRDSASRPTLVGRFKKPLDDYSPWRDEVPAPSMALPAFLSKADRFTYGFYTYMLHSCLVDADFIDTETFMNGRQPRGGYQDIPTLLNKLTQYLTRWDTPVTSLNVTRSEILTHCINASNQAPGLFTLTVPTGGGKTISSLRFALEHAVRNKQTRIIYVIPYTSIIDQTAQIFKNILGEDQVLEHHSGMLLDEDSPDNISDKKRLATENWDAPIIVTTAVQFFESIFSNKPSKSRKLHNITNAVVIFDEAQTFPVPYLRPCIAAISQLVKHYHTTAVLCTATQPEFGFLFEREGLIAQEIIPDSLALYQQLKRITLKDLGATTWLDLGEGLSQSSQVLCIVNRRKSAQQLYQSLPKEGSYCLSTLICPYHRRRIFEEIRKRLKNNLPCRVVSTSLIEAGVDLDFPTVYREKTGLDSILQAAGRCNREGNRPANESVVWYFISEDGTPPMIRQNVDALKMTQLYYPDLASPEAISKYFESLWYVKKEESLDQKQILDSFEKGLDGVLFPFRHIAEQFRLIESPTQTIYIPTEDNANLIRALRRGLLNRTLYRELSQYSVAIYPDHLKKLHDTGVIECLPTGDYILQDKTIYHPKTGLALDFETGLGYFI